MTQLTAEITQVEQQGLTLFEGFWDAHCIKLSAASNTVDPLLLSWALSLGVPTALHPLLLILPRDGRTGQSLFWALSFSYSLVSLWFVSCSHSFKYYLGYINFQIYVSKPWPLFEFQTYTYKFQLVVSILIFPHALNWTLYFLTLITSTSFLISIYNILTCPQNWISSSNSSSLSSTFN